MSENVLPNCAACSDPLPEYKHGFGNPECQFVDEARTALAHPAIEQARGRRK